MPPRAIYLLLIRLLLGYVFASSGLCKLTGGQFGQLIGPPTPEMVPGLGPIWGFLAAAQVAAGALVLSGRWALLGLVALVPLNAGILAFTLANDWNGTPFVNGLLLGLNLLALADEWPSLRFFLVPDGPIHPLAPRVVRLFPGRLLPTGVLLGLGGAAGAALSGGPFWLVVTLGACGLAAAWAHALGGLGLGWLERAVIGLTGLAVLALTLAGTLDRRLVIVAMYGGVLAGTVGALALAVAWAIRRRGYATQPSQ